jgi:hypothetical protein
MVLLLSICPKDEILVSMPRNNEQKCRHYKTNRIQIIWINHDTKRLKIRLDEGMSKDSMELSQSLKFAKALVQTQYLVH